MARFGHQFGAMFIQTALLGLLAYALPLARFQPMAEAVYRRRWALRRHWVRTDDLDWSYLDSGGHKDAVVLVHGFGADKYRWGSLPGHLSRRFRVVSPDLPGFGETQRPPKAFGAGDQARRLIRFMDTIGIDRCHVAGTSMGGLIASYLAAEHPDRVDRLVLMAPANMLAPEPSPAVRLFLCEGRNVFMFRNESEFLELVDALFFHPPWMSPPLTRFIYRLGFNDRNLRHHILNDLLTDGVDDLEGSLAQIKAKTLILWGDNDRIFDPSGAREVAERISDAQVRMIRNCGHIPFYESPKETVRQVIQFLSTPDALEEK